MLRIRKVVTLLLLPLLLLTSCEDELATAKEARSEIISEVKKYCSKNNYSFWKNLDTYYAYYEKDVYLKHSFEYFYANDYIEEAVFYRYKFVRKVDDESEYSLVAISATIYNEYYGKSGKKGEL